MKEKKYLLSGLVFGIAIGWVLGFLRLPFIEKNCSFLLGFIAAMVCATLFLFLLAAWNKQFLYGLIGKKRTTGDYQSTRNHTFVWIILFVFLVLGGILVFRHNTSLVLQIQDHQEKIKEMGALVAEVQQNNLGPLLRSMLEDIDKELKRNSGRTLSDTTIARMTALSSVFKPYKYMQGDSLSEQACSPERGQLLQALVLMNIDSGTFTRIKQNTLFAGADLRGMNLKGLNLSGINLNKANLNGADLSDTNFKGADLGAANLWGANLNRANLSNINLKRADLRWAQLNETNLKLANLNGANLSNAQLIKADLTDATFQRAQSVGALFNDAIMKSIDFAGTNLTKANLSNVELSESEMRSVNLSEAVLIGVKLNNIVISNDWLEKLIEWQPVGLKELQANYTFVSDTADKFKRPLYRFKKK
jgi:uncharacterized protein YjbI with pentapeptide repeats